jgi:hypothetical protein
MTIKKVIGTAPSQVPRNKDLGTMAYQDANAIQVGQLTVGQLTTGNTLLVNRDSNGVHLQTQVSGENSATLGSYNSAPSIGSNKTGYSGIMFNGASYEPTLDGLNVRQSALVDIGSVNYRYKNGHFTGINFPATQVASANANTLDDYEEGTWATTDASGAGLSITINGSGYRNRYTKIGNLAYLTISIQYPITASTNNARLTLPFPQLISGFYTGGGYITYSTRNPNHQLVITTENSVAGGGSQTFVFYDGNIILTNADFSNARIDLQIQYLTT